MRPAGFGDRAQRSHAPRGWRAVARPGCNAGTGMTGGVGVGDGGPWRLCSTSCTCGRLGMAGSWAKLAVGDGRFAGIRAAMPCNARRGGGGLALDIDLWTVRGGAEWRLPLAGLVGIACRTGVGEAVARCRGRSPSPLRVSTSPAKSGRGEGRAPLPGPPPQGGREKWPPRHDGRIRLSRDGAAAQRCASRPAAKSARHRPPGTEPPRTD